MATEHAIKATGITYTIFRNPLYADFLAALGLNKAIAGGELITCPGTWRITSVTRADLALAIANVLSTQGHENKTYELTAAKAWGFAEVAEILAEISGKPIAHRADDLADNWLYRFLAQIDTVTTTPILEQLMGRPPASLKDTIKQIVVPNT